MRVCVPMGVNKPPTVWASHSTVTMFSLSRLVGPAPRSTHNAYPNFLLEATLDSRAPDSRDMVEARRRDPSVALVFRFKLSRGDIVCAIMS